LSAERCANLIPPSRRCEQQQRSVPIGAGVLVGVPRGDAELRRRPHFEQVRDVQPFGVHPTGEAVILLRRCARDVEVVVAAPHTQSDRQLECGRRLVGEVESDAEERQLSRQVLHAGTPAGAVCPP